MIKYIITECRWEILVKIKLNLFQLIWIVYLLYYSELNYGWIGFTMMCLMVFYYIFFSENNDIIIRSSKNASFINYEKGFRYEIGSSWYLGEGVKNVHIKFSKWF